MLIVVMKEGATAREMGAVIERIEEMGLTPHLSREENKNVIGIIDEGSDRDLLPTLSPMEGVERTFHSKKPYKLASRDFKPEDTIINVGGLCIGGKELVVMAGPCAVEGRDVMLETAQAVKASGAVILRGGAFKPRTSPYSFQGLGVEGLKILHEMRQLTGMPVVTEVLSPQDIDVICRYVDILQVGARNMQNFNLLQQLGRIDRPVLLKRGMMSSLEELLMSAEYILSSGNSQVMLCERGIRTFEKMTRNTLDISAVPLLKKLTHLPVIVDPSHAAGAWDLVGSLSRAAVAAGADGLIIEVHPRPTEAMSDGAQSLKPKVFHGLMKELRALAKAMGRTLR